MSAIEDIDYRKLEFDEDNPRLPEKLRGAAPEELAKIITRTLSYQT